MKIINVGTVGAIVADTELNPGAISESIEPALARKIVAESGGALAIAPESEHTAEELATADEKPKDPPPPPPPPEGGENPLGARKGKNSPTRKDDDDEKKKGLSRPVYEDRMLTSRFYRARSDRDKH